MDKASLGGAFLAISGIVAGLMIEGGSVGQILQPTAALIVFGGTLGAVLLQYPFATVLASFRNLPQIFAKPREQDAHLIRQLVGFANKARRNGVVSLDHDLAAVEDPFLKQALMLAVDGTEPADLRKIMRVSLDSLAEDEELLPSVFESAGGFAPRPSASWEPFSVSSRSCIISKIFRQLGAASLWRLSPPSMASVSPISFFCRSPERCASASATDIAGAR